MTCLALVGLWSPAVLAFFEPSYSFGTTAWLLLPLCSPEDTVTPAVAALVVYVLGATTSVVRRPWPWVVGGLVASLAYDVTIYIGSIGTIC